MLVFIVDLLIAMLIVSGALYGIWITFREWLRDQETVDAVPVIRCKDCKHRYIKNDVWTCPFGLPSGPDGYCSYGEREENG